MIITIIVVAITALVSILGFSNEALINKLILWPRIMHSPTEYYRLLTSGFIHADWNHLLFNMMTLYFMGGVAESMLGSGFITLYTTGIIVASLPSFLKNKNNSYYRSLGASGGVASIIFFFIYFYPWGKISIMFIPIGIPAILFGALYLMYEAYMAKRGQGNVNHDAHFWGSVYGLLYAMIIDPTHGLSFINAISNPQF